MSTRQLTIGQMRFDAALDQRDRLWEAWGARTRRLAERADPATGGWEHLVRNWGNAESRAVWEAAWRQWRAIWKASDAKVRSIGAEEGS